MKWLESSAIKPMADQVVHGVNYALSMSPDSQKHLSALHSCTVSIEFQGLDGRIYLGVEDLEHEAPRYRIQLLETVQHTDILIKGSPLTFIKLMSKKKGIEQVQSNELVLEGDSAHIQHLLIFLHSLHIDWEGLLARVIGDVPAHIVGASIRSGLTWGAQFSQSLIRDMEEFITFELRLLPDKRRAHKQFSAISSLAEDLDIFTQRFDQLASKANK